MPRAIALLIAAAVVVTATLSAPVVTAAGSADPVRTGFRIPADGTAGGYWVGSRSTGGQVVYRIDPGKPKIATSGFGARLWRSQLKGLGPRTVSTRDTARAAWILAKYGTYRYDIQNAAVEIALDQLLYGGAWSLTGSRTNARLATVPERATVREFAATMLADSSTYAGPYRVALSAGRTMVGSTIPVSVRVTAATTGAGVPLLPLTVTGPGGTRTLRTDATGRATTSFTATTAGTAGVRVAVTKVPESRLLIRPPSTTGASRVAIAGLKTNLTASTTATVLAVPSLRVSTGLSQILAGTSTRPQIVVGGLPAGYRGTATARLYGPVSQRAGLTCRESTLRHTQTIPVSANATYQGAALRLDTPGYYGWSVTLSGSNTSVPVASGCAPAGAVVQVTQW